MRKVSIFSLLLNTLLGTLLGQWQTDQHPGAALWDRLDGATAAHLGCSLSHRGEAHASATLRWDAHAIVDDLKPHFLIECKAHDAAVCLGMTRYVGKRLLRDAVDSHFDCSREVGEVLGHFHQHAQSLIF